MSLFLVLIVMVVAAVALVVALVFAWRRRSSGQPVAPVCGGCGYQLAPNPMGLTVCPECGGDFLSVGILAPNMKLGRRGSPAVPLGIAWFILVGVGMVPLHRQLAVSFTKLVSTNLVTQTSSGHGPFRAVGVSARREQVAGEKAPDVLTAEVTITGEDGKDLVIVVDGVSKTISEAPAASGLKGLPWDKATTHKIITATGGGDKTDDESATKMRSIVDDALAKTAGGGTFGGIGGRGSFSSSSSSSGISTFKRSSGFSETASSSSFTGSAVPMVIIGSLRGLHWVTFITCAIGLLLAFAGLWAIVRLTRQRG